MHKSPILVAGYGDGDAPSGSHARPRPPAHDASDSAHAGPARPRSALDRPAKRQRLSRDQSLSQAQAMAQPRLASSPSLELGDPTLDGPPARARPAENATEDAARQDMQTIVERCMVSELARLFRNLPVTDVIEFGRVFGGLDDVGPTFSAAVETDPDLWRGGRCQVIVRMSALDRLAIAPFCQLLDSLVIISDARSDHIMRPGDDVIIRDTAIGECRGYALRSASSAAATALGSSNTATGGQPGVRQCASLCLVGVMPDDARIVRVLARGTVRKLIMYDLAGAFAAARETQHSLAVTMYSEVEHVIFGQSVQDTGDAIAHVATFLPETPRSVTFQMLTLSTPHLIAQGWRIETLEIDRIDAPDLCDSIAVAVQSNDLSTLRLGCCALTQTLLDTIMAARTLRHLAFSACSVCSPDVLANTLAGLAGSLRTLSLSKCWLSCSVVDAIARMSQLAVLDIAPENFCDQALCDSFAALAPLVAGPALSALGITLGVRSRALPAILAAVCWSSSPTAALPHRPEISLCLRGAGIHLADLILSPSSSFAATTRAKHQMVLAELMIADAPGLTDIAAAPPARRFAIWNCPAVPDAAIVEYCRAAAGHIATLSCDRFDCALVSACIGASASSLSSVVLLNLSSPAIPVSSVRQAITHLSAQPCGPLVAFSHSVFKPPFPSES